MAYLSMIRTILIVALALASISVDPGEARASEVTKLTIGYLSIDGDRRYEQKRGYAGVQFRPAGRPRDGATIAMRESRVIGRAVGIQFEMLAESVSSGADLISALDRMRTKQAVRFFLVDAGASNLLSLADAAKNRGVVLFNVSERADRLRGPDCRINIRHVIPSYAMQTDSLAQFLSAKGWRDVFVLVGPNDQDKNLTVAFENSATRFGLQVVARKNFLLSNDPRHRSENNVRLMTSGADHDVVFLADTDGEFGRYVPYQTRRPRPVIGTEGLLASAWHWSWERNGAPQLNQRFERRFKRHMSSVDWAAWVAVKAVVEAVVRTGTTDFTALQTYLGGSQLTLDGYKGTPMSFRSWDNQLRQPLLVHTANAVIERTPIRGFFHKTQNLDTLGYDVGDKKCRF